MTILARIKKVSTGEVRVYKTDVDSEDYSDDQTIFQWTEGNYSCDCNRGIFFDRNEDDDSDDWSEEEDAINYPCGDPAYKARVFCDGRLLVHEFNEHPDSLDPDKAKREPPG